MANGAACSVQCGMKIIDHAGRSSTDVWHMAGFGRLNGNGKLASASWVMCNVGMVMGSGKLLV
jgi:hypothetical protein